MKRDLAIEIYQLFETSSPKRAAENFDLFDKDPKNLPKEYRFLVKQSYAAAALAITECAKACDACDVEDRNDCGDAATGAAGFAASKLRALA